MLNSHLFQKPQKVLWHYLNTKQRRYSHCPLCTHNSNPIYTHYSDVIMGAMASQITSLAIVYSTVYSDADQRKQQSSASLPFVREIHRWPVNSPHKGPVTRKMFPFDDVIMSSLLVATDIYICHDSAVVMVLHRLHCYNFSALFFSILRYELPSRQCYLFPYKFIIEGTRIFNKAMWGSGCCVSR